MCHLLLVLPFLALPVFWLLPLSIALPIYTVVAGLGLMTYACAIRALRKPVITGRETMLGAIGRVMRAEGRKAMVFARSELWSAEVEGAPLAAGELAQVVGIDGVILKVRKLDTSGQTT